MHTLHTLSLGLAAGALVAGAAHARDKDHEDYSLTLPPPPPPPSADGAIFQADAGYAALYEGWKARRVGDPLTIVRGERTVASQSLISPLDSKGQVGLMTAMLGTATLWARSGPYGV